MNELELRAAEEKQQINSAVEAARQEKKTIQGHCEICGRWAILYPIRGSDPARPDDTVVEAYCIKCMPARQAPAGGPEPRRD